MEIKRREKKNEFDDKVALEALIYFRYRLSHEIGLNEINGLVSKSDKSWKRYIDEVIDIMRLPSMVLKEIDGERKYVVKRENSEEDEYFEEGYGEFPEHESLGNKHADRLYRVCWVIDKIEGKYYPLLCWSCNHNYYEEEEDAEFGDIEDDEPLSLFQKYQMKFGLKTDKSFFDDVKLALKVMAKVYPEEWQETYKRVTESNFNILRLWKDKFSYGSFDDPSHSFKRKLSDI